jgi:hypothetical protein
MLRDEADRRSQEKKLKTAKVIELDSVPAEQETRKAA